MSTPLMGHDQGAADICAALGLDARNVRALTLRVAVGEVATVDVTTYVLNDDATELVPVLETFNLVKKHA